MAAAVAVGLLLVPGPASTPQESGAAQYAPDFTGPTRPSVLAIDTRHQGFIPKKGWSSSYSETGIKDLLLAEFQPQTADETLGFISGVSMTSGQAVWTVDLRTLSDLDHSSFAVEAGRGLVLVAINGEQPSGNSRVFLASIDAHNGKVISTRFINSSDFGGMSEISSGALLAYDQNQKLIALDATHLNELWRSTYELDQWPGSGHSFTQRRTLFGTFLVSTGGLLRVSDGTTAAPELQSLLTGGSPIASSAQVLDEDKRELAAWRTEDAPHYPVSVAGFDLNRGKKTWAGPEGADSVTRAGDYLVFTSEKTIAAYTVGSDELRLAWKTKLPCSDVGNCALMDGDSDRVLLSDGEDSRSVWVLNARDGSIIGHTPALDQQAIGHSVLYGVTDRKLRARDMTKSGLPVLWSADVGERTVEVIDGKLTIHDGSLFAVVGSAGNDWTKLTSKK